MSSVLKSLAPIMAVLSADVAFGHLLRAPVAPSMLNRPAPVAPSMLNRPAGPAHSGVHSGLHFGPAGRGTSGSTSGLRGAVPFVRPTDCGVNFWSETFSSICVSFYFSYCRSAAVTVDHNPESKRSAFGTCRNHLLIAGFSS